VEKQVLFIQGAGEGAHKEDAKLAESLSKELGTGYHVRFPEMPGEDSPDDSVWRQRIAEELSTMGTGAILVGHSAGGATLIMFLAENEPKPAPAGAFLIAAPFCGDEGWDCGEFVLPKDLGARVPTDLPLFLYHGRRDEIVPFAHVGLYEKALPQAVVRRLDNRNHQLNDDLSEVASDIMALG
jgi:predicted alpha/beta hydrolase family esterase